MGDVERPTCASRSFIDFMSELLGPGRPLHRLDLLVLLDSDGIVMCDYISVISTQFLVL